jgi:hypothetical protein
MTCLLIKGSLLSCKSKIDNISFLNTFLIINTMQGKTHNQISLSEKLVAIGIVALMLILMLAKIFGHDL